MKNLKLVLLFLILFFVTNIFGQTKEECKNFLDNYCEEYFEGCFGWEYIKEFFRTRYCTHFGWQLHNTAASPKLVCARFDFGAECYTGMVQFVQPCRCDVFR